MAGARILLIEDEPVSRRIVRLCLRGAGFDVAEACSGVEAIRAVQARRPDLVLVDLRLPDCSGTDLARRLRALPGMAAVPLCAISGVGAALDSARLRGDLFEDFFLKPLDLQELPKLIRGYLRFSTPALPPGDLPGEEDDDPESWDSSTGVEVAWRRESGFLAGLADVLMRGASPAEGVERALALAVDTGAATFGAAFRIQDGAPRLVAHRGLGPGSGRSPASLVAVRRRVTDCAREGRLAVVPPALEPASDADRALLAGLGCGSCVIVALPTDCRFRVTILLGEDTDRLRYGGNALGRILQGQLYLAAQARVRPRRWSGERRMPTAADPVTGLLDVVALRSALVGWGRGSETALVHLHIPTVDGAGGPSTPILRELCTAAREMTRSGDLIARLSGEDFLVLMDATGEAAAAARASMLLAVAQELLDPAVGALVTVGTSRLPPSPEFQMVRAAIFSADGGPAGATDRAGQLPLGPP